MLPFRSALVGAAQHAMEAAGATEVNIQPLTIAYTKLEGLPISRPAVSQHLKALLDCNLVSVKSEGTRRIYALNAKGFDGLNLWLDQFWS